MNRAGLAVLLGALWAVGCGGTEAAHQVALTDGFESPESAYFEPIRQCWFVSNVSGAEPGDGFISRLDANGQVVERVFASGLDDPKGQRADGDTLYVTDNTRVVAIDLNDPENKTSVTIEGSQFLNDIAIDPSTHDVYVSDTFDDAIWRISSGTPELVLRDPALEAPNGLLFEHGALLVASIGPDLDPTTFTTSAPGRVFRLDPRSAALTPLTDRVGDLDGIEADRRGLLVSENSAGVDRIGFDGSVTRLINNADYGLATSADIGLDRARHRIAVPELFGTRVAFFDLTEERRLP